VKEASKLLEISEQTYYRQLAKEQTICTTLLSRNPLPVSQSSVPGLDIVPAQILLSNANVELTEFLQRRVYWLKYKTVKVTE